MFTRDIYSSENYAAKLAQSTQPLLYKTNPEQMANCDPCEQPWGPVADRQRYSGSAIGVESIGHITDVESALRHQSTKMRMGSGRDHFYSPPAATPLALSQQFCPKFAPEHSRISHPRQDYRELDGQYRQIFQREHDAVDYIDPRADLHTRQMAKDSYVVKLPQPLAFRPDAALIAKIKGKKC